jgi:predicted Zn finger-like uncharacterized protein
MDVKCEQCSAEYDFDESLLGDKGTTVKCSTCGHIFRVQPRRGAPRPTLQLRYARSGQVEQLGSLRDLQSLIHAGVVSADDLLGRQGFPWRRLGDVPELRNFFTSRSAGGSTRAPTGETPNHNQLRVSPTSMAPPDNSQPPGRNQQGGRTVLGVGPGQPQIPGPPRVPSADGRPQPQRSNGAPEAGPRAPTSDAPTASRPRPDFGGSLGPSAPPRTDMASMSQAPTVPGMPPVDMRRSSAPATDTRHPGAAAVPPTPSANPVRLYLAEDEASPARATADNSKIWVYAIVLVLLAGGGWLGINALAKKAPAESTVGRVEVPTPSPTVTPTTPPGSEQAAAQGSAPAPTPEPGATPAPQAQPAPVPSEPAQPAEPAPEQAAASGDKPANGGGSGGGSGGKEPKDYGGWVAKGDQAFSKGDLSGARKAYETALALRATGSEANTGLGFTLLGEGKAQEAIPHFDRAAGSGYAEANIGLGDAYRRLGQKPAAIEAYKDYLERLPGGSRVSYVKKQLEALGGAGGGGDKPAEQGGSDDGYRPAGETKEPEPLPSNATPAPEGTP